MPCVTARMAIRPKRLKWVKTVHAGTMEEELEFERG
jgi:1,2-diacylglycerol 3-beta-glucosyltransferase